MKKVNCIISIVLLSSFVMGGCSFLAKPRVQHATENKSAILAAEPNNQINIDKGYLLALNTADRFLNAWLKRDFKEGPELVTEKVKSSMKDEELKMFFSGVSNPHHQGYEITGKEYVDANTIRFQVWLYEYYTGETLPPSKRPAPYFFDVVKVSEENWLVNSLPSQMRNIQGS